MMKRSHEVSKMGSLAKNQHFSLEAKKSKNKIPCKCLASYIMLTSFWNKLIILSSVDRLTTESLATASSVDGSKTISLLRISADSLIKFFSLK